MRSAETNKRDGSGAASPCGGKRQTNETEAAQHRPAAERDNQTHESGTDRIPQTEGEIYRHAQRGFVLCDRLHHMVFEKYMKNIAHRSQHWVLLYLQRNGGSAWQKEIAEAMEVSPAAMTGTVKKLEKSGYVTKTVVDRDNRKNQITLTSQGAELLQRGKQQFDEINQKMFVGIDGADLVCFARCLQRMEENLYEMLREANVDADPFAPPRKHP